MVFNCKYYEGEELKFSTAKFIVYFVSLIFIFGGALIFCEIVIINKFGLNTNTKPGYIEKMELENIGRDSSLEEVGEED